MKVETLITATTTQTIQKPKPHDTSENDWWWFKQKDVDIKLLELVGTRMVFDHNDPKDGAVEKDEIQSSIRIRKLTPQRTLFVSDSEELLRWASEYKFILVSIKPAGGGDFSSSSQCDALTKIVRMIESDPRF